jgi:hypothetical protein
VTFALILPADSRGPVPLLSLLTFALPLLD